LKQIRALLMEDDCLFIEGKRYEVLGRMQIYTGKTRYAVKKGIKELLATFDSK